MLLSKDFQHGSETGALLFIGILVTLGMNRSSLSREEIEWQSRDYGQSLRPAEAHSTGRECNHMADSLHGKEWSHMRVAKLNSGPDFDGSCNTSNFIL